jgi:hypothetical protein
MKTIHNNLAVLTLTFVLAISACVKEKKIPQANIRILHTSADAGSINAYFNEDFAVRNSRYGYSTGYIKYTSEGMLQTKIFEAETNKELSTSSNTIIENNAYSIIAYDSAKKMKQAFLQDNRSVPIGGKIKIRFFNLSPNTAAVDLVNGNTTLFGNMLFANFTNGNYTELNAGNYSLAVKLSGTPTVISSLATDLPLLEGKMYTLFLSGFSNNTDPTKRAALYLIADN